MTTPRLIALPHLAILDISGDDAQAFLHAQVPSDIRKLDINSAQISGWCTAKGRLLTTFVIWPNESGYRLVLASDVRDAIAKRLKMFVLRLKVQVTPSTDLVYGLLDPSAQLGDLVLPTADWQVSRNNDMTALRLDATRVLLTAPESNSGLLAQECRTATPDDWYRSDIAMGFPLVTQATSEHYVPQMVNLDKLGGVSFKKGCYPGQEIVARTHYLGKIKRHLYRIRSSEPLLAGSEVRSAVLNGQSCGSVLSAAPSLDGQTWEALAVLQQDAAAGAVFILNDSHEQAIHVIDLVLPEEA